jgi:prepilin-type N-terminal cleavage/methylation domain-containing protein
MTRPHADAPHGNRSRAFSLVELLVAITVIGLLVSVAVPAWVTARAGADAAGALSNLRQIGSAITLYTGEHDGLLPGPLWPGQVPAYDATKPGRLAVDLAPYLKQSTAPGAISEIFVPPAYRRHLPRGTPLADARTYVMNMSVPRGDGTLFNPWGSRAAAGGLPFKTSTIPDRSKHWAMSDADRLHPAVKGAPWAANTPADPIHGQQRTALFFDGSASKLPLEAFVAP